MKTLIDYLNKIQFFSHKTLESHKSFYDKNGIYILAWPEEKALYVGQTQWFYKRLNQHFRGMKWFYHDYSAID